MIPKRTTVSKTIKLPIEGIQFSNKVVMVEFVYDGQPTMEAVNDEINQWLGFLKDNDPSWIKAKEAE